MIMTAEITALDYILLPFYLWLIYKVAFYYRDKYYPESHPLRPYFIPGLTAKIGGAIFIGLFYNYYYGGGDTFNFFYHSQIINSTFTESPTTWLRLITHSADETNLIDMRALSDMYWYDDLPSYVVSCLGAFIGMFCFTTYLVINVIVGSITFIGIWLLFTTFAKQYRNITKYIAIAILFMPGPNIWGSGLFKDSFCMFAIGCLIYCCYELLEERKFKVSLLLLALLSMQLLLLIKAYIFAALVPLLIIKIVLVYKKRAAASPKTKTAFNVGLVVVLLFVFLVVKKAGAYLTSVSAEDVIETIIHQKDYLLQVSLDQDGSAYDLGDFDPTLPGIAKMILPAINVTLFRPYPWESKSIIQLFNSLESTATLLLTLYLIFKVNPFKTIKNIYRDPNLILCLSFALVFAFIVGVSTYNFGSLSRYKIPCVPFYILFLVILIFKDKVTNTASAKPLPNEPKLID